jgi:hypothetical protein
MAQIKNAKALTVGDGSTDTFNVNTSAKQIELPNGAIIQFYSDAYSTAGAQVTGGGVAPAQSATAPAIANAGTINTAGVGVARVSPASAVTGIILQAGTIPGQQCLVVNEAAGPNTISFNTTPATSNVANSANEPPIPGLSARLYVWDSGSSLWYSCQPLINGALATAQSSSAPVITNGNTINTAGVGVARVAPGGAVTGIILQAGTTPGQVVTVINESAAANTITWNTTPATANIADSATEGNIPGLTARTYCWDSSTSLWYRCN